MKTINADSNSPQKETKNIKYTCNRNTNLSVNFTYSQNKDEKKMAIINGYGSQSIILPNKAIASGFLYTNGKYTLRGKGQQATWTIGRMVPFQCSVADKVSPQEDVK
jgi:membrane-bound inhibitor of C-type lysozyme